MATDAEGHAPEETPEPNGSAEADTQGFSFAEDVQVTVHDTPPSPAKETKETKETGTGPDVMPEKAHNLVPEKGKTFERGYTMRQTSVRSLPADKKEVGNSVKQRMRDFFGGLTRSPLTTLAYILFSVAVCIVHEFEKNKGNSGVDCPNFFLGLIVTLLSFLNGFRSNTAYARWWEGRCLWGKHIYLSVDLAQKFATFVPDRKLARRLSDLIVEFAHFSRLLLRLEDSKQRIESDLHAFSGDITEEELMLFAHTEGWKAYTLISAMRQVLYSAVKHDSIALFEFDKCITELAKCIGGCIRIRNSPLPKTYVLYLHLCSFLFLLLLPLTIVKTIGWWAVLATALNVLMLLGIQGISEAMEEPFGKDDDDLKLDEFCNAIEKQVHAQVNWILENKYDAYHGVQDRDSSKRRGEDVGAKASLGWRVGAGAGEQNLGSTGVSTALPERDIHARAGAAT